MRTTGTGFQSTFPSIITDLGITEALTNVMEKINESTKELKTIKYTRGMLASLASLSSPKEIDYQI